MDIKRSKNINMLQGPIFKGMVAFSIPLMLTNFMQLLFNTADLVIVGRLSGDLCLAAVSATGFVTQLIVNLFVGIAIGVNVLIAHEIGKNSRENISKTIHTSVTFGLITGVILSFIGIASSRWSLVVTSCPDNLLELATTYLKIYYLAMPALLVYNYGAGALRAKGDTRRPLFILLFSGAINVVLNIVMIVVFGMDVDGVAIATVVSEYTSAIMIIYDLMHEADEFRFDFKKLQIDLPLLKEMLSLGIPAGFQSVLFTISNVVLQVEFNHFGSDVVAAVGAAHTLESFTNAIVQGVVVGVMTYISQNRGARNYKRIKDSVYASLILGLILSILISLFGVFCGDFYMSIYSSNPDIIAIGQRKIYISMILYETYMLMQTGAGAMRGLGYSRTPTTLSLIGVVGVRLLYVYTFFKANPILDNLFITYPLSWIVASILIWPVLIAELKTCKKQIGEAA